MSYKEDEPWQLPGGTTWRVQNDCPVCISDTFDRTVWSGRCRDAAVTESAVAWSRRRLDLSSMSKRCRMTCSRHSKHVFHAHASCFCCGYYLWYILRFMRRKWFGLFNHKCSINHNRTNVRKKDGTQRQIDGQTDRQTSDRCFTLSAVV